MSNPTCNQLRKARYGQSFDMRIVKSIKVNSHRYFEAIIVDAVDGDAGWDNCPALKDWDEPMPLAVIYTSTQDLRWYLYLLIDCQNTGNYSFSDCPDAMKLLHHFLVADCEMIPRNIPAEFADYFIKEAGE